MNNLIFLMAPRSRQFRENKLRTQKNLILHIGEPYEVTLHTSWKNSRHIKWLPIAHHIPLAYKNTAHMQNSPYALPVRYGPSFSDSFAKFIAQETCSISRVLNRMSPIMRLKHLRIDEIDFLTFRDGEISYMPAGKEQQFIDGNTKRWAKKGRQTGKPAKVIKKIMSPELQKMFKAADFEAFTNKLKAESAMGDFYFEVRDAKDLEKVYNMPYEDSGSLGSSCMRNSGRYYRMFELLGERVQVLVLRKKNDLRMFGRALMWKCEVSVGGRYGSYEEIVFMDRVYTSADFMNDYFLDYCDEKKMWRRYKPFSKDDREMVVPPGDNEAVEATLRFDMSVPEYDTLYPYLDTFHFGNDDRLSNDESGMPYTYSDTEGAREGDDSRGDGGEDEDEEERYYCPVNEELYPESEMTYVDRGRHAGSYVHSDDVVTVHGHDYWNRDPLLVPVAGDDEDMELIDECTYIDYIYEYYRNHDVCFDEVEEKDILNDDAVELHDFRRTHIKNATKVGDIWYLSEEVEMDDETGMYRLKEAA